MAETGAKVVDRVIEEETGGRVDRENNLWYIPAKEIAITSGERFQN